MAGAFKDLKVLGISHEENRFARDSPVEQSGFEPLVPPACGTVGSACIPCCSPKAPVCNPGPGVRIRFAPAASQERTGPRRCGDAVTILAERIRLSPASAFENREPGLF